MSAAAHISRPPRLLFVSVHSLFDPSSGAALSTRDLLTLLTRRGWSCRAFCGPHLDFEDAPPLPRLLTAHGVRFEVRQAILGDASVSLYHFAEGGVPFTLCDAAALNSGRLPGRDEAGAFLALFERVLERFRPDLLLTYGGHALAQEVIARAKGRGVPVAFTLRNFAYRDARLFRQVDAAHVPSRYAQDHYRRTLGLECTAIPGPFDWDRVRCPEVQGRYVTFINPQPAKGVFVFARIAEELARRRPDIPLLVVEGRGQAGWLERTGLNLHDLGNVYVMGNTADPREIYRVSRLVLMPSLWRESFGRVAAEALVNGIPVLASRRGALPETLEHAGFLFDFPERCTTEAELLPTAAEVEPWVGTILRLWDDGAYYEAERRRCRAAAEAWRPERLGPRFEEFFLGLRAADAPR